MKFKKLLSLACIFSMLLSFLNMFSVCGAQKTTYKVVVIGDTRSGKTQIYNRLSEKNFDEKYSPSDTASTVTIKESYFGPSIEFCFTPGSRKHQKEQVIPHVKDADLVLVTVNMRCRECDMERIIKPWVDLAKKENPNAEIDFIGAQKDADDEKITGSRKKSKIEELYSGSTCIVTSAKNNDGIQDLVNFVSEKANKSRRLSNSTSFKVIVLSAITAALFFSKDIYNAGKAAVKRLIGGQKDPGKDKDQKLKQPVADSNFGH